MARDRLAELLGEGRGRAQGRTFVCFPVDLILRNNQQPPARTRPARPAAERTEPSPPPGQPGARKREPAKSAAVRAADRPAEPRSAARNAAEPETARTVSQRAASPPRTAPRVEAADPPEPAVAAPKVVAGASVLLGVTTGLHPRPFVWAPAAEVNPFLLAVGGSGSGKTSALRLIAEDLGREGVAVLILDVHGDVTVPGYQTQALGAAVGINPLLLPSRDRASGGPQRHAQEVTEVLEKLVPQLGHHQAYRLRRVLESAYAARGFTDNPATWVKRAPTFADVLTELQRAEKDPSEKAERSSIRGLLASLDRIFGDPVYRATRQLTPERLLSGRLRLDLTGLTDAAQRLVADAVLRQLFGALRALGPLPGGKGLRVFVICDEAAKVASSPALAQIFREARKFGFGLALASQLAQDFGKELRGNAGTLLVLRSNSSDEIKANAKELRVPEAQVAGLRERGQALIRTAAGSERLQLRMPGSPRPAAGASCGSCAHGTSEARARAPKRAAPRDEAAADEEPSFVPAEPVVRPPRLAGPRALLEPRRVPALPASGTPPEPSEPTPAAAPPVPPAIPPDASPPAPAPATSAARPPETSEETVARRRTEGRVWIASQFKKRGQPTAGQQMRWAPIVARKLDETAERRDDRGRLFWEGVRDWLAEAAAEAPRPRAAGSEKPDRSEASPEASPPVPDRAARAAKLRKLAEHIAGEIDRLRNSGTHNQNPTARRARIIASQEQDADRLDRVRAALLGLADAIEGHCEPPSLQQVDLGAHGCVPPSLQGVESRALVEELLRRPSWPAPVLSQHGLKDMLEATAKLRGLGSERRVAERAMTRCERYACGYETPENAEALERLIAAGLKAGTLRSYEARTLRERIGEFKRAVRAGLRSQAEWDQARADLQQLAKPVREIPPLERRIRDAERDLIGRKFPGFFPTPRTLVERMVAEADLRPGLTVLEPSAGKGDIAVALRAAGAAPDLIEMQPALREILQLKGFRLVGSDFLEHAQPYDRIVMNPPFENGADMAHVRHAYDVLRPGGRLVAIMSEGPFFRQDKRAEAFRLWLDEVGGAAEQLPAGTFLSSDVPTGVSTRIVVIDKPGEAARVAASAAPEAPVALESEETCPPGEPACGLGLHGGVCGVPAPLLLAAAAGAPVPRLARYCLTSASQLIPSHDPLRMNPAGGLSVRPDYPPGVQERPYDRDRDEAQKVIHIAAQMRPELVVTNNPDGINGPPVVTQRPEDRQSGRAIVLGGNGRTMAVQRHYAEGGTVLKEYLVRHARAFGFAPDQVRALADPVIVRVVDTSGEPAELRELVRLLNVGLQQELGQKARASAEASRLSDEAVEMLAQALAGEESLADYLSSSAAGAFAAALQRAGILTERNRKLYVDPDGTFTRDGKTFVERLLVAAVITDARVLDTMPDNLRETLARGAPWLVAAAVYGSGWDLRPDLTRAAEDLRRMRQKGVPSVDTYLAQIDAFEPPASSTTTRGPSVLRLVHALQGRPVKFARFAQRWAQLSRQHLEAQGALFAAEAVTPEQALTESAQAAGVPAKELQ